MKRRTAPHIKMRKLREHNWWEVFAAPLREFIALAPRSWQEIEVWCKVRQYTDVTMQNLVAFLDLDRQIEQREFTGERGGGLWAIREDDGSHECKHGRMFCTSCEWIAGFKAGDLRRTDKLPRDPGGPEIDEQDDEDAA